MRPRHLLAKYKHILLYGASLALLLFLLKWLQWRYLIVDNSTDIYIGLIAALFTGLGIWIAGKLGKPKVEKVIVEKEVYVPDNGEFNVNEDAVAELNLSSRELEVLELMSRGLSNAEIAENLFVSLSTVKSHSANLFRKLDVQRRTQAIDKGKRLRLIR